MHMFQAAAIILRVAACTRSIAVLFYLVNLVPKSMTMIRNFALILFCLGMLSASAQESPQALQEAEMELLDKLEQSAPSFSRIAQQIWDWAEVGYQEERSSALLQDTLQAAGFSVEAGVAGMPTAFVASFGSGKPVVALLAEFDALPGISQEAVPYRAEIPDMASGHACGHHLFGTGSVAAALAVRDWMAKNGIAGTIRVYGTPAEEGGAGKVYMVREGLFEDVDAVLHWHPSSRNDASASSTLANKSAKFRFYGTASHAASAPDRGRSALDGVEAMNYMDNLMREHVPMETRIHYVITEGGAAPNVVPEFAEVYYYVRHPEAETVRSLFERVAAAAEGAAQGTGTRLEYEVIHGLYNVMPNEPLAELMYNNLARVGGVAYNAEEKAFARQIMESYPEREARIEDAQAIEPYEVSYAGTGGSTDVGDVSWVVPTAGMGAATWVPGTSAHSWQAIAAGGMSIGKKGMLVAAKTLALTAMDLFEDPEILEQAQAALDEKRGAGYEYQPLLGDRDPPLDYRN